MQLHLKGNKKFHTKYSFICKEIQYADKYAIELTHQYITDQYQNNTSPSNSRLLQDLLALLPGVYVINFR